MTPRYLIAFDPKRTPHYLTDILIIGAGLAGLRAANAVPADLDVLVVTKDQLDQSSSHYAQGGIAGVMDKEDRFEDHIADTLRAGGNLCDRQVVEMVVREAPARIQELIQWGTRFDQVAGELALGREGGHSRNRIVHALGDATGREVMRAMIERTQELKHVRIWENTFTVDLLTDQGRCWGALVVHPQWGPTLVWAKQTILCSGGAGRLYRETTNPPVATGDGVAMAYRAGARIRDMEFMQFHPTVLYIAGSSRSLITEAVRGEGGWLVDRTGYRFMPDYDARAELAPRDIVARAIVRQMEKTHHPCVYLTLSHLGESFVRERFPGMDAICRAFGLDIAHDPIPVRPGAHYLIGGVAVDGRGHTGIAGLWAAGEVTASGLHGANRLASNSLLEALVFGAHAGQGAAQAAREEPGLVRPRLLQVAAAQAGDETLDLADIRNSLQSLMWRSVGILREKCDLERAREQIDHWAHYVMPRQFDGVQGWQLQNMVTLAQVMVQAALWRCESRGVHYRVDFPEADDRHWRKRLWFQRDEATGQPRTGEELLGSEP
ncbi:MAG: L-aspartate oxidase [Pirellulaceae bacterium]|nr:MAG: L-aspartate oxidase [Pirellulaceae bacterium]